MKRLEDEKLAFLDNKLKTKKDEFSKYSQEVIYYFYSLFLLN